MISKDAQLFAQAARCEELAASTGRAAHSIVFVKHEGEITTHTITAPACDDTPKCVPGYVPVSPE